LNIAFIQRCDYNREQKEDDTEEDFRIWWGEQYAVAPAIRHPQNKYVIAHEPRCSSRREKAITDRSTDVKIL
jgi:hypothetical protein